MHDKAIILLIGTDYTDLANRLNQAGYSTRCETNSLNALLTTNLQAVTCVIISANSQPLNGYQLCRLLKHDELSQQIPVILDTSLTTHAERFWSYQCGADAICLDHNSMSTILESLIAIYHRVKQTEKARQSLILTPALRQLRLCESLDRTLLETDLMTDFRNLHDLVQNPQMLSHMLMSIIENVLEFSAVAIYFPGMLHDQDLMMISSTSDQAALSTLTMQHLAEDCIKKLPQVSTPVSQVRLESIIASNPKEGLISFPVCRVFPMTSGPHFMGALAFWHHSPLPDALNFPLNIILAEVTLLFKQRHLVATLEQMTLTDTVTQLYHHPQLMAELEREMQRARRYELPLCLLKLDVDQFQSINQSYGFDKGDMLLALLASTLQRLFRKSDFIARYSADEFMVIMPDTNLDAAEKASERFLDEVRQLTLNINEEQQLSPTVSMGLAYMPDNMSQASEMIGYVNQLADQAKEQGGNCLVSSSCEETSSETVTPC